MFVNLKINLVNGSEWKFRKSPINPDAIKSPDGSKRADVLVSPYDSVFAMTVPGRYAIRMCDITPEEIEDMRTYLSGLPDVANYELSAEE